ncbi:MAG: hypothetical protein A3F17_03655 [Gammaproteobacteria bacterium RIFCSPHIGHO2_12_FULL_41_15]|nr:MAG: hypothetical protein A3F17_03655 [Gammaproteobacteria bacterium RIFCSPHIGHO2_12_FULL_41_15]
MTKHSLLQRVMKACLLLGAVVACLVAGSSFAAGSDIPTVQQLSKNLSGGLGYAAQIMQYIAVIAGVGFIFGAFHKFHANKMNPQQVPLSQGITMFLVGSALLIFPTILESGAKMLVSGKDGSGFQQAKIGGDEINGYIVKDS